MTIPIYIHRTTALGPNWGSFSLYKVTSVRFLWSLNLQSFGSYSRSSPIELEQPQAISGLNNKFSHLYFWVEKYKPVSNNGHTLHAINFLQKCIYVHVFTLQFKNVGLVILMF